MKTLVASTALALLLTTGLAAGPASAAQTSTQLITTLPGEALPISDYYNQNVYDNRDNKIGEVNDLPVDNAGKVNAVILGVGGFLGVGEKNVAVAFPLLKVAEKAGKRYLVPSTRPKKRCRPCPATLTIAAERLAAGAEAGLSSFVSARNYEQAERAGASGPFAFRYRKFKRPTFSSIDGNDPLAVTNISVGINGAVGSV